MKMVINIPEKDAGWIAVKDLKMHPLNPREHSGSIKKTVHFNQEAQNKILEEEGYDES